MNFRISTFNLFQFCSPPYSFYTKKEKFSKDEWEDKIKWIKETLKHINSDIIAFQEVFTPKTLELILKDLGYKYFNYIDNAVLNKNTFETCIVMIASKYPIKKIETLKEEKSISNFFDFDDDFKFSRKPIKAYINIENTEIIVYVFHLKSNRLNEFEYKFLKNTRLEEKLKKSIESFSFRNTNALKQRICEVLHLSLDINKTIKKYPNLLALGDLNDKEYCLSIDLLTNKSLIEKIFKSNSFEEFHLTKNEFQLFDTYYLDKNYKQRPYTSYYQNKGNVLDYIFISEKLKKDFNKYHVFDEHLKDNKNGSLVQTDHAIVYSDFELN